MHYITKNWLDFLLSHQSVALLDDAMRESDKITQDIRAVLQMARNSGDLRRIEGIAGMAFEPGHCWNEFCEDPDGMVSSELIQIRKILGPKIEDMIRATYASGAVGPAEIDTLATQISGYLDHPVITATETSYAHHLDEGRSKDRILVEIDGFAPRVMIPDGPDGWQSLVEQDTPDPAL